MDFDDDAPPELVDVGQDANVIEEVTVKVPITIVTGMPCIEYLQAFKNFRGLISFLRLPRSGKDDTAELHSHCSARQEDSRYYEWYGISLRILSEYSSN